MLTHQRKLKHVRFFDDNDDPSLVYLECAALVKQGKVYGIGTEDMDVREIPILFYH